MPTKKTFDLEKSLQELEALTEKMEQGDLSLEESLKLFERGVTLTKTCQTALREAEHKIKILTKDQELVDHDAD